MGKSPGKWIKGILFGKKTSKSDVSKGRVLSKSPSERPAPRSSSSKKPATALLADEPVISPPVSDAIVAESKNPGAERKETANGEKIDQEVDGSKVPDQEISEDQHQQAVVTLQAAARGHLVRRQAVATYSCIQGIVKLQALARAHMVRNKYGAETAQLRGKSSRAQIYESCEVTGHVQAGQLLKNGFIQKLCCSSPSVMPLRLEYDQGEPNSSWSWLLRWSSALQVWAPDSEPKKILNSKLEAVETECSKNLADHEKQNGNLNTEDYSSVLLENIGLVGKDDKLKKHENKNVAKPAVAETDAVIPRSLEWKKPTKSPAQNSSDKKKSNLGMDKPVEEDTQAEKDDVKSGVAPQLPLSEENLIGVVGTEKIISDHFLPAVNKESTDDQSSIFSQKSNHRRASLPAAKHEEYTTPESSKKLPSYMAKTASSKAKVKAAQQQASPRLGVDRNSLERRLSLPSSVNGKMNNASSSSPRLQNSVRGKGMQVDWKR